MAWSSSLQFELWVKACQLQVSGSPKLQVQTLNSSSSEKGAQVSGIFPLSFCCIYFYIWTPFWCLTSVSISSLVFGSQVGHNLCHFWLPASVANLLCWSLSGGYEGFMPYFVKYSPSRYLWVFSILLSGGDETNVEGWRFYECLEMVVIFTKLFSHCGLQFPIHLFLNYHLYRRFLLTLAGLLFYFGHAPFLSFPSSVDYPFFPSKWTFSMSMPADHACLEIAFDCPWLNLM